MCDKEFGIDSMSYYYGLTPEQKQAVVGKLKLLPDFQKTDDYWKKTCIYRSNCFQAQGVKLTVSQIKGYPWGLLVAVHPMLVLGDQDRSRLYRPEKKREYQFIVKQVNQLLSQVEAPCSVDDMKLYRCDVTGNLTFDESEVVDEYIRILKKSCLLPRYSWDKFWEKDHKARDCKVANQHSCKQFCKSAAFFAYDKTAQMEMIESFPDALIGKHILRLEAQLRRKAMKKWGGKAAMDSGNWAVIKALGRNVEKILCWYLKRVQPVEGDYLRYQDAAKIVSKVRGAKTRERMLYLLRKTSDSNTSTVALEKLKRKYGLSGGQCRTIFKHFRKLGVNPITLKNSSQWEQLPGIRV